MKKEETRRKKEKGEKTKQKLFIAATMLFNQYGFRGITVDRIVEEAGVAKGTFYIYFESKDALIAAFISDYVRKVDTDYRVILDSFSPDTSSSQILLGLFGKIADTLTEIIGYTSMRTVYQLLLTDAMDMNVIKGYDRDLYQIFYDVLECGIKRGEFSSELSLEELTRHFVMAIRGISYEWCIRYPDFDLKAQALSHFQILLNGIKSR
ncbi:MAG: TetR/AcrR family transcriptional regulator [Firmicutes bacterium]|nr:TetR/AcrR family transcriptional regulator [Bacillota bacterium]